MTNRNHRTCSKDTAPHPIMTWSGPNPPQGASYSLSSPILHRAQHEGRAIVYGFDGAPRASGVLDPPPRPVLTRCIPLISSEYIPVSGIPAWVSCVLVG